jgi:ParB-like chromosome segregation protein Spo0J
VHPAAALLPMMGDDELADLAADIKANGLQQPIVVWEDNTEAAYGGVRA